MPPVLEMPWGGLSDLKGVLFPLSGEIAVLMVMNVAEPTDECENGPLDERILKAKGTKVVNRIAWAVTEITCVMGHLDDPVCLLPLPETGPTASFFRPGHSRRRRETRTPCRLAGYGHRTARSAPCLQQACLPIYRVSAPSVLNVDAVVRGQTRKAGVVALANSAHFPAR
ncbi:hypothetical protein ACFRIB_52955 [Streptomyces mirabilis]|uniref:hypothetical protein n=1 Tax=Streptomyces mirabilis TaxID=68239 RepID=UPI0036C315F4